MARAANWWASSSIWPGEAVRTRFSSAARWVSSFACASVLVIVFCT